MRNHTMKIKWGRSRAKGSEGELTCGCWLNGTRVSFVTGSGFDVRGAAFGEMLGAAFGKRIAAYAKDNPLVFPRRDADTGKVVFTPIIDFYPGVRVLMKGDEINAVTINGEVGFAEMVKFTEKALGIEVALLEEKEDVDLYVLTDTKEGE